MTTRIAINGFGRIGRNVVRALVERGAELELVAVNDLTDPAALARLLKYDSTAGRFGYPVEVDGDVLVIDGRRVKVLAERDPAKLPWGGYAPPSVYEVGGKEYVVVTATGGGKVGTATGDAWVAFALPE